METTTIQTYNENKDQRKRCKQHSVDVSVTVAAFISTFAILLPKRLENVVYIVFFGSYFHYKAIQHFYFACTKHYKQFRFFNTASFE